VIVAVAGVLSTLWGIFGHTQIVGKLGPIEWFFVTPSHHRVHHGSNESYIDKNYGNFLIIWDRFFGTFEAEKEKVKFGLVKNVNTFNPITITGSNPIKGRTIKNGILETGPSQACLKATAKFISSLE
jgi:hypothetical protein